MTNEQINKATIGANKDQAELVRKANLQEKIDLEFDNLCGVLSGANLDTPLQFHKTRIKLFIHEKIKETEDKYKKKLIKELKEMNKEVRKQKYLHYGEAHIRRFRQGYNQAILDIINLHK